MKLLDITTCIQLYYKSVFSIFVGEFFGIVSGLIMDMVYMKTGIYIIPKGAVVTPGIAIGITFGWLGGLISHKILHDIGMIGGTIVGVIGSSVPIVIYVIKMV